MNKLKLNDPDVEQSTTIPLIDQQEIIDFKRNHVKLDPHKYGEIKIEPDTITYNGKVYVTIDSSAIEEVKQEWIDDGYTWEENKDFITIYREDPLDDNVVKEILINKSRRTYECYNASDYDSQSLSLTLEEHARLTKTFRAKGWKV